LEFSTPKCRRKAQPIVRLRRLAPKSLLGDSRRHQQPHDIAIPLGNGGEQKFNWASEFSTIFQNKPIVFSAVGFLLGFAGILACSTRFKRPQFSEGRRRDISASRCLHAISRGSNGFSLLKTQGDLLESGATDVVCVTQERRALFQRQHSNSIQAVLLSAMMILVGCNGEDSESNSSSVKDMSSVKVDEITVLFPTSFGEKDLRTENDVTWLIWSEHNVELDRGKFSFDDKVYGMIASGEVVTIAEDGTVSVDGVSRPPLEPGNVTLNGVRFALETHVGNVAHENGAHRFVDMVGKTVELKDGQFTVEGKSYGEVAEGDVVEISINGSVSVNGEPRETQ